jgi:hypothetical protein
MSGVDLDNLEKLYRINEINQIPLNELQDLYKKAIDELIEEKIKYEEYECKYTSHDSSKVDPL